MRVFLHPAAEQDIQEAAAFYEREGTPMVAARFIAEFKRLTAVLVEHPEIGSPRVNGRRGLPMSIFPYTVIYRASGNEIRILVVKHDRKRPEFGARRA
ncbi:MAG: type II toxin-antitoxin system RelE/ParE family toxin [Burkholderiales bacterium]|nr:type II toxin-antitoxin system RelE/ParE family toxin [Burkholderiales bacterium]